MLGDLAGTTVGVTADRRWAEQASLLERRGARVLHGPSVKTLPARIDEGLRDATHALLEHPPAVVVLTTGVGTRSWIDGADSLGLTERLLDALRGTTVIARGPKAAGAAATAGLDVEWVTPTGRSSELVDHLRSTGVAGTRVAIQLDGGDAAALLEDLVAAGADVVPVRVYRWVRPDDETGAQRLIEAACDLRLDAVTFTSAPAVTNLLAIAAEMGRSDDLLDALNGPVVPMCIGEVCGERALDHGLERVRSPERPRLGAMVHCLAGALGSAGSPTLRANGTDLMVRASAVLVDGHLVDLSERELAVLRVLAERPGAAVAKSTLLRRVWGAPHTDEHAVEVTVARLRRRLGPAGAAIETAVRRGYRLVADEPPSDLPHPTKLTC